MKVLITGGAGFIGSRTALLLLERGHTVRVLDNLSPQVHTADPSASATWQLIAKRVESHIGDVSDRALLDTALEGCDAVLHLAAETGTGQSMYQIERYVRTNVTGTAILLEAVMARREQIKRVVVASSRSIYGEGSYRCSEHGVVTPSSRSHDAMLAGAFEPSCPTCAAPVRVVPTAESAPRMPGSVYAVTKLAQEQLIETTCGSAAVPWMALRYQNVYGPGQSLSNPYTGVLSVFSRLMLEGQGIEIFEDGNESRDFVYIDDVAAANVKALEAAPSVSDTFNVGSGVATSLSQLVAELARNYGYTGKVTISGRFRAGDIRHNVADVTKLANKLQLDCKTSFAEGMAQFCSWVRTESVTPKKQAEPNTYRNSISELETRGLIKG